MTSQIDRSTPVPSRARRLFGGIILAAAVAVGSLPVAAQAAPAVTLASGGDGIINKVESESNPAATWDNTDPTVTGTSVWFEDAAGVIPTGCGPWATSASGVGSLNPTCAANLPDGTIKFVAEWTDGVTPVRAETSSILDTVAAGHLTLGTGSAIDAAAIAAGVKAKWYIESAQEKVNLSIANASTAAPSACTFADLGKGTSTVDAELAIPAACFAALSDGTITASIDGVADAAGNPSAVSGTATLLTKAVQIEILDGADNPDGSLTTPAPGYVDNVANGSDTAGGLGIRVDLSSAVAGVADVDVTVTDRNGATSSVLNKAMESTSSVATRTVKVPVAALAEGALTVRAVVTDETPQTLTALGSTSLDTRAPVTTWSADQAKEMITVRVPFLFTLTSQALEGNTRDQGLTSGIQFVYLTGVNKDTKERFGNLAQMAKREASSSDWELGNPDLVLSPGVWKITAYSQDLAGNLEAPSAGNTIEVTVEGV